MKSIDLLALDRTDWKVISEDPIAFAQKRQLLFGAESDLIRAVAQQTVLLLETTGATAPPWSGYLAVDRERDTIVGMCSFKAPPDGEGVTEIAYFTFPDFEGQGCASAMAGGLVERGNRVAGVRRLRAHTLPERNASTRILEKCGFERCDDIMDPEDGLVWRWEREPL